MNVRWVDGLSVADRVEVERQHGLRAGGAPRQRRSHLAVRSGRRIDVEPSVTHRPPAGGRHGGNRPGDWPDPVGLGRAASRLAPLSGGDNESSLLLDRSDCTVEGTVKIAGKDATGDLRLTVQASAPSLLFFSEPYYAERRVWVDGSERPLERVNVALSGVWVDAGSHVVELQYVPSGFRWGLVLSGLTLLCWLVAGRKLMRARSSGPSRS